MSRGIIAFVMCGLMLVGVSNAGVKADYDGSMLPETTDSTVVGVGFSEFAHTTGAGVTRSLEDEDGISYLYTDTIGSASPSYYTMDDISGVVLDPNIAYTIQCRLRINDYSGSNGDGVFTLSFDEPDAVDPNSGAILGGKDFGGLHSFTLKIDPSGLRAELYGQDPNGQSDDPEGDDYMPTPVVITDSDWHTYTIKVWPWNGIMNYRFDPWPTKVWDVPESDYRVATLYVDGQRSGVSTASAAGSAGDYWEFGNFNGDLNAATVDYDVDWVKITSLATADPVPGARAAYEGGTDDEMLGIYGSPPSTLIEHCPLGETRPLDGAGSVRLSDGTTTAYTEVWSWSGLRPIWDMHYMTEENGAHYQHIEMEDTPMTGTNMYWTSYARRLSEYDEALAESRFEKFFGQISVDESYSLEWRFRFQNFVNAGGDPYYTPYWVLSIQEPGDHYPGDGNPNNTGHIWILQIVEAIDEGGAPAKVLKFYRGWGNWYSGNVLTSTYVDPVTTPEEGGTVIDLNQWYHCRMVVEALESGAETRVAKLYVNGQYSCGVTWENEDWFEHYNPAAHDYTKIEFGNFSNAKASTIDWDLDYMRTGLSAHHDCDDVSGVLAGYSGGVNLPFDVAAAEAASGDGHWRYPNVLDANSICLYDGNFTEFTRNWGGASNQVVKEQMFFDNEGMVNEIDYFHCDAMDTDHPGDNLYYSIDDIYEVIPVQDPELGYTIGWRMRVNDYTYNDPTNANIFALQVNEPDDTGESNMGGVWTVVLNYDDSSSDLVAKIATSGWGNGAVIDNDWHDYKLKVYTAKPSIPGDPGTRMARLYVDGEAVYASTNGITPVAGSKIFFGTPGVSTGAETGIDFDLDYLRIWIDGVPTDCQGAKALGYLSGDVTGDCKIDMADLVKLAQEWLDSLLD